MEGDKIFLIIFIVVILLILIVVLLYAFIGQPNTITLNTQLMDTQINTSDRSYFIMRNGSQKGRLENIASIDPFLNATNYITISDSVGIKFLKTGYYNFQIFFNITSQGYNGNNGIYLFISNISSDILNVNYDDVNGKVYGPSYLYFTQTSYNEGNDGYPSINRYLQNGEGDVGGVISPLIVFVYPCKTNNSNDCYSNYYTVSASIKVEDLSKIYYIQSAYDNGNYLYGSGNISIQYQGEL